MDIRKFIIFLTIFTIGFLFVEKEKVEVILENKERPKVSFDDLTMYDISKDRVEQIVKSKQADLYNNREELTDAIIVMKSKNNVQGPHILSGSTIIQKENIISLFGNVNLRLSDGLNIKTEQLEYNKDTKIAQNTVDFIASREKNELSGDNLYLDSNNEHIIAKRTKFRMKVENE